MTTRPNMYLQINLNAVQVNKFLLYQRWNYSKYYHSSLFCQITQNFALDGLPLVSKNEEIIGDGECTMSIFMYSLVIISVLNNILPNLKTRVSKTNFKQPQTNTSLLNRYIFMWNLDSTMQQYPLYRQHSRHKWVECSVLFLRSLCTMWWVQFFAATSFWHTSTFSNFRTLPPPSKLKSQNTIAIWRNFILEQSSPS